MTICPKCNQPGGVPLFTGIAPCDNCINPKTKDCKRDWEYFYGAACICPDGSIFTPDKMIAFLTWEDEMEMEDCMKHFPIPTDKPSPMGDMAVYFEQPFNMVMHAPDAWDPRGWLWYSVLKEL